MMLFFVIVNYTEIDVKNRALYASSDYAFINDIEMMQLLSDQF